MSYTWTSPNVMQGPAPSGSYTATGTDLNQAEAPLSRELSVLVNNIADVEQALAVLGARLAPVSLCHPRATGAGGDKAPSESPVVEALRSSNWRLAAIRERISEIACDLQV